MLKNFETVKKSMERIHLTERFDPARYRYLQSLFGRVQASVHADNSVLLEKIVSSLEQYQSDFSQSKKHAEAVLIKVIEAFPRSKEQAEAFFEMSDFNALQRLYHELDARRKQQCLLGNLSELVIALNQSQSDSSHAEKSLDEMLQRQELNARSKAGLEVVSANEQNQRQPQLQSMKGIRESMKYFNLDRMILDAIENEPENAGPHNPHMLAIKSLMKMKELSPQYLRRFASYIETVLWLEKNAVKLNRKKPS